MSWRSRAAAVAGPLLIVAFTLFALRGFVVADRLTNEHPDILSFWLPRWSFLGRTLAAGDLPLWNPFEMTGYRFAADPQSGWLYAPPMLLFSALRPTLAMRTMIVLQPLLGGLGLYAFLRTERFGRVTATFGGLALVGLTAASEIAIAMPFAGAIAWGTIVLLAAARCLRASAWSSRLGWIALGGFAWSQVASAHLSHGLVAVTAVVVANVLGTAWGRRELVATAAAFLAALPLLSLAVLVPRFQFLSVSSLAQGYDALGAAADTGADASVAAPIAEGSVWLGWPLAFATAPGAYLGAAALLAVPLAWRARDRRRLVLPVTAVLAATWLVLAFVGWGPFRAFVEWLPFGDVLLHNPARLRYVAVLALPLLAAAGLQGLRDEPLRRDRAWIWMAAGAAVWIGVPLALGATPVRWVLVAIALVPAAWLLTRASTSARWAPAVVGLLALELVAGAAWGGLVDRDDLRTGLEGPTGGPLAFQPLRDPDVDAAAYVRPTAFVELVGDERYLTWAPPAAAYEKGYLFAQDPVDWPALANERGTLFGIRDALGYNPVQLPAYWTWIRERNPLPMYYNASVLARPTNEDLATLGVTFAVVPEGVVPPFDGEVVATTDGYDLVRLPVGPGEPGATLTRVSATELRIDDAAGRVRVDEAYDPGWSATPADGAEAPIEPDGPEMAVTVPGGPTTVTLRYADPWVVGGLWAGLLTWLALGATWFVAWRRGVRPTPGDATPPR
ncbi:MAG TPA: hypothetical protein VF235_03725 [Actinomycetota bacterium]